MGDRANSEEMSGPSIEALWVQFHQPMRKFILKRVGDEATTEDLMLAVCLKIHEHIHALSDQEQLQAWLYQLTHFVIKDHFLSEHPTLDLPEMLRAMAIDDAVDDLTEPIRKIIWSMIEYLPEAYQTPLMLTEFEGYTPKQVAGKLGLSLSGVKSRVQCGREQLRDLLLRCCHFQFDLMGQVIDYQAHCRCCTQTKLN